MKKICLLIISILGMLVLLSAQPIINCGYQNAPINGDITFIPGPDTTMGADLSLGIGGDAFNSCYYEYTFQVHFPDTLFLNGTSAPLVSMEITSIVGLPAGIDSFQCSTPDCIFFPSSINTVTFFGTPNDVPGDYNVIIITDVLTGFLPSPLEIQFPNATLAPGEYTLTLNADPGPGNCPVSCAGLSAQVVTVDETCFLDNGAATVVVTGGSPPYTFQWCTGAATSSINSLANGEYFVYVRDAAGCTAYASFLIGGLDVLELASENETCLGDDGTATVVLNGTANSYDYLWNTGGTTQTITGLVEGYYAITIDDAANNCSLIDTVFVAQDSTCIVHISGQVLIDHQVPDCMIDPATYPPQGRLVSLFKNGQLVDVDNVDAMGNYSFTVDTGKYDIVIESDLYDLFSCPASNSVEILASTPGASYTQDFFLELLPHQDLCVEHSFGPARPGFTMFHWISYCNYGSDSISGNLTFVHDPTLITFDADGAEDSYDAATHTATFSFSDLAPGDCVTINLTLGVPITDTLGQQLTFATSIYPQTNDINLNNNTTHTISTVTGSYDPNDKQNLIAEGTFSGPVYPGDDRFHYFIRFQNTGTDTAFTVVVKDEIQANLDITTLRPVASSHDYDLSIQNQRTLVFTFNDILLVDSTTNEPGSHGFVSFTMDLVDNLPVGTVIENDAAIFFDFNAPILTNVVVNTITERTSTELDDSPFLLGQIYPNPANELAVLEFSLEHDKPLTLEISDLRGRKLSTPFQEKQFGKGNHAISVDLESLPTGILFFEIIGPAASQSFKVVKF